MADFSEGQDTQIPVTLKNYATSISICYEIAFGEEVIRFLPAAAFLVNVSNNAWFGDSSAPHQQLQMARMRALETGRDVMVATNDGVTAIVNHRGKTTEIAPQFEQYVLRGTVQPRSGATLYVRVGNYPVISFLTLLLITVLVFQRNKDR
jgi:apolipoprotein N-acyltransferase